MGGVDVGAFVKFEYEGRGGGGRGKRIAAVEEETLIVKRGGGRDDAPVHALLARKKLTKTPHCPAFSLQRW